MTTLQERLRGWAIDAREGRKMFGADQDLHEAAQQLDLAALDQSAEVERLRAELDAWKQRYREERDRYISILNEIGRGRFER